MKVANETTGEPQENDNSFTTVTAPEIVCGGCASSITKAFAGVEGVAAVEVDVPTKKVTVTHNKETSRNQIVEVLERAGYSAE
jgi:copper chaperone